MTPTPGKYKRHWGAYGKRRADDANPGKYNPDAPPAQRFRNPVHCVVLSNDDLLYVCDRSNNRVQVFHKDGSFVRQFVFDAEDAAARARPGASPSRRSTGSRIISC